MTSPTIEKLRDEWLSSNDRHLYSHIGFFMSWFAAAEMSVSFLLALATKSIDMEGFKLLVRGMDARVKCERLRKASKSYKPIGAALDDRLKNFEKTMIGTRNKIAHSVVVCPEPFDKIYFCSHNEWPSQYFEVADKNPNPPEFISTIALFKQGLWLNFFSYDLHSLVKTEAQAVVLEITHPHSPTRQAFLEDLNQ